MLVARIIYPASREDARGDEACRALTDLNIKVRFAPPQFQGRQLFPAAVRREKVELLAAALREEGTDIVWSARGGYGVSELLPHLPWEDLRRVPPKTVIGFSDVSALQAALWRQLGWPGLHGPMPAREAWRPEGEEAQTLRSLFAGQPLPPLPLTPLAGAGEIAGTLFGGCLSVLTNLIGTPYFPALTGTILFLEDVGESAGQIMRYWNQWLQAGALRGVQGLVVGELAGLDSPVPADELKREMGARAGVPVWSSEAFGHLARNTPLPLGVRATIRQDRLAAENPWRRSEEEP